MRFIVIINIVFFVLLFSCSKASFNAYSTKEILVQRFLEQVGYDNSKTDLLKDTNTTQLTFIDSAVGNKGEGLDYTIKAINRQPITPITISIPPAKDRIPFGIIYKSEDGKLDWIGGYVIPLN